MSHIDIDIPFEPSLPLSSYATPPLSFDGGAEDARGEDLQPQTVPTELLTFTDHIHCSLVFRSHLLLHREQVV